MFRFRDPPPGYVRLQGIGVCEGIPAERLEPGMLLSWNYSPCGYEVVRIDSISPCYLLLTERNRDTGQQSQRRLKRDRLVVADWPKNTLGD